MEILKKSSSDISETYKYISPNSAKRRLKSSAGATLNFDDLPVNDNYISILQENGVKIENKLKWFNAVTAYLTDEEVSFVRSLSFISSVEKVRSISYEYPKIEIEELSKTFSANHKAETSTLDYGISYAQYELSEIPVVHNAGIDGAGVLIGILDTGFDWNRHESLNTANVLDEYDFVFHDTTTANDQIEVDEKNNTQHNHGTAVFSVIGGYKPGNIIGPAYNSQFVLAKTEYVKTELHAEEDNYAAALEWMDSIGVDITTASLGYSNGFTNGDDYSYSDMDGKTAIVTKAAEMAFARGIVVLNAAGNEGNTIWHYINAPSDGFNVIAVGAVDNNNSLAGFSSRGPSYDGRIKPEITARGVSVYGASAGTVSAYGYSNGTSLATPIASGVAALLLSAYPHLTNVQVRNILLSSGLNWSAPDNEIGYGLISAKRAINYPNIDRNLETLHKAFIDVSGINPNTLKFISAFGNEDLDTFAVQHNNGMFFSVHLPQINTLSSFYFTYLDSSGIAHRDPEILYYNINPYNYTITRNITPEIIYEYSLENNYPNPFNSSTNISFTSKTEDYAEVHIYNILGQKIRTLFKGNAKLGRNPLVWDGKNDNGYPCASGIYYYRLKIAAAEHVKKMILVK